MNLDAKKLNEFLEIQRERQLAMEELSKLIGVDISFSEEEIIKNANEEFIKYVGKEIEKEVSLLMKSLFS